MTKRRSYISAPGHPLANVNGYALRARLVLWDKCGGVEPSCHWCGDPLTWRTVCADHLNDDSMDDRPENLVPSCRGCNANREGGTGYGRRTERQCPTCGASFKPPKSTARFCSKSCAGRAQPKRPPVHPSASAYNHGCRCADCRAITRDRRREWAKRTREAAA